MVIIGLRLRWSVPDLVRLLSCERRELLDKCELRIGSPAAESRNMPQSAQRAVARTVTVQLRVEADTAHFVGHERELS